jgi:NitT/TauT family transport system substrate-binding protein/sulfonate transport system substrate-binding protein
MDHYATSRIVAGPKAGIGPGEIVKLRGRKVGLLVGTDPDGALRAWLSTAGLTIKDVQPVNVRFPDSPSALATGSVDAVCVIEPWAAVCQLEVGAVPVTAPGQYPPIFMPGLILTGADTLVKRRGELLRFLAAFAEAQQWSRKNTDKAIDINLTRVKTLTAEASRLSMKTIGWDMRMTKKSIAGLVEKTVPVLAQLGVLREDVNAAALVGQIVDVSLTLEVQRKHPEFFEDLPPIPAGERL